MQGNIKDHRSLRKRFEGNEGEVVKYAETFGLYKTADKYDTGLLSMRDFLEVQTGNKDFGVNPTINSPDHNITASTLVDAFVEKVVTLQAEKDRLITEINQLRRDLEYRKAQESLLIEPKLIQVMQILKD
jgi:hypothetical protein